MTLCVVIDSQLREGERERRIQWKRTVQKVDGRSFEAISKKAQKHTAETHQRELVGNQGLNPFVSGSFKENTVLRKE